MKENTKEVTISMFSNPRRKSTRKTKLLNERCLSAVPEYLCQYQHFIFIFSLFNEPFIYVPIFDRPFFSAASKNHFSKCHSLTRVRKQSQLSMRFEMIIIWGGYWLIACDLCNILTSLTACSYPFGKEKSPIWVPARFLIICGILPCSKLL